VRGSKGSKVLRTRKIKQNPNYVHMYSYFCSNGCYNDFANKYVEQVIRIAPRHEPLETKIEDPKKVKYEYSYGSYTMETKTNHDYTRRNRFTGESIELTKEEADKHDKIFYHEALATLEDKELGTGASKHWQEMRNLLDWFMKNNAKAYMVLLD
jgi:hypothetical protein